jgi:hypothetical protein
MPYETQPIDDVRVKPEWMKYFRWQAEPEWTSKRDAVNATSSGRTVARRTGWLGAQPKDTIQASTDGADKETPEPAACVNDGTDAGGPPADR